MNMNYSYQNTMYEKEISVYTVHVLVMSHEDNATYQNLFSANMVNDIFLPEIHTLEWKYFHTLQSDNM